MGPGLAKTEKRQDHENDDNSADQPNVVHVSSPFLATQLTDSHVEMFHERISEAGKERGIEPGIWKRKSLATY